VQRLFDLGNFFEEKRKKRKSLKKRRIRTEEIKGGDKRKTFYI